MTLTRRTFLTGALAGGSFLTLQQGALRELAFAATPQAQQRILVVVHLRGACDGLNLVCPANDPHLIAARAAELRVAEDGSSAGHQLKVDAMPTIDWRLHPAANELAEFYKDSSLGFVHAAGIPEANRSHFVATDIIDHGAADGASLSHIRGGWLGRYLAAIPDKKGEVHAISASASLSGEFSDYAGAFSVADLNNGLPLPWDDKSAAALRQLYQKTPGIVGVAGQKALEAAATIAEKLPRDDHKKILPYLEQKEGYDKSAELGRGLRTIARLIKLDVGLVAASVDLGGWDTHENQPGRFNANVQRLSSGLAAFWNDLSAYHNRLLIVAYGEFGRRLRSNRSNGTDHGRGGVMLTMGGSVKGGRIIGPWPGLDEAVLDERVDLPVKTDYRQVMSELLLAHGGAALSPQVFPGYKMPGALGIMV